MRIPSCPRPLRSLLRSRSAALALLLPGLAAACATVASPPASTGGAASTPRAGRHLLEDDLLGYSLELPPGRGFQPGDGSDSVVARGPDGTVLRVFPEHFSGEATRDGCWERLLTRLPAELESRPSSAESLAETAAQGLVRGERRLFFAPYTRGPTCFVLVVDGPVASPILAEAAPLAIASFQLGKASTEMEARLAFDAGIQLLDGEGRQPEAALQRFEEALAKDATLTRAHLGAGLAAFFAGETFASRAIEHLEKTLAARSGEGVEEGDRLEGQQLMDALMYLGLSYAAVKDYPKASARLAETVSRFPDDPIALYNFACVLALQGEVEESLHQLRDALTLRPELASHALTDTDLTALRPNREFEQLVGGARSPAPATPGPR